MRKLRNLDNVMPAVDFDFRHSKHLDPRITFTRASFAPAADPGSGTGTAGGQVNMFNVNVPRLTDKGLLIEEAKTNIFFPSIIPETTSGTWGIDGADLTANAGLAPDGSNTATLYDHSASTGNNRVYTFTGGTVQDEAYSFFIKDGGGAGVFAFQFLSGFGTGGAAGLCQFDFSTNTLGGPYPTSNPEKVKAIPLANGWFRITATNNVTITGLTSGIMQFGTAASTGNTLIWGFQREEATTFCTSYIPTTTAAVTRARDVCEITGDDFSSWYAQGIGTLVSGWTSPDTKIVSAPVIIKSSTAKNSPGVIVYTYVGAGTARDIYGSVTGSSVDWQNVVTANTPLKLAITYDASTQSTTYNGNTPKSVAITTAVPTMIRMDMGDHYVNNDRYSNGYISRIAYYPTRVSDSALQGSTRTGGIRKL